MSDTIARVTGAIGAIGSVASLLFGTGGVTIGDVTLQGMEVPERIAYGGAQSLAVHKLIGGDRVIDTMGRDDMPIAWGGVMLSADASDRARALDALRVAGAPVPLIFGGNYWTVVIRQFTAHYRRSNWIDYQIQCEVLRDQSGASGSADPADTDAASSVSSDLRDAQSFIQNDVKPAVQQVSRALASAQVVVAAAGAFGLKTQGASQAISALQGGAASIGAGVATAEGVLGGLTARAAARGDTAIVSGPADLNAAATQAATLAQLRAADGYVGRAIVTAQQGAI